MRHVLRIVVLCRVLDAVVLQVLQPHFSDDSPMLRTLGEGAPCVSSELVECLALKLFSRSCAFLIIRSAGSGGNTTLSAPRYSQSITDMGWPSQMWACQQPLS